MSTPKPFRREYLVAALCLLSLSLVVPGSAVADIIPLVVSSCRNADEGDRCSLGRTAKRGTCVPAPCRGKDYSNGSPPEYYYYACLKCMTADEQERLAERIESGAVEAPEDLPQSKRKRPGGEIEIIRGDDYYPGDPPDLADDDKEEGEEAESSADDVGQPDADAGTDADRSSDVDADTTPDASTEVATAAIETSEADAGSSDADAVAAPSPEEPDDAGVSTNTLVTAGSIALGILLVFVGFRGRRPTS